MSMAADDPLLREAELLRQEVSQITAALHRADVDSQAVHNLAQQVRAFSDVAASVAARTTAMERLNRRLARTVWALAVVIVALVVLGSTAISNARRIGDLQERTSSEVLCPVFQIYLDAYRPEAVPPERLAHYEHVYRVMLHSYEVLQCTAPGG